MELTGTTTLSVHRVALAASGQDPSQLTGLAGFAVDVVERLGPAGVGLLVAAENLFPPLPSEVILPVAGYVASQGKMSLVVAIVAATLGSYFGALALYWLGALLGRDRLHRIAEKMPLVDVADVEKAEEWFARYGGAAVLFGRCIPLVRSFISVPAGIERMPLLRFSLYTLVGSAVWNTIFVVAGYQLGTRWTDVGKYSDPINYTVVVVIALLMIRFVVKRLLRARAGMR
ncbi:MAG TPA: DedA family protein [Mycobacteriales bacterium]|jgi:membrane protein DedA with SNARE-associated domain|nr:DedA family protein [Mycobacteriales bacterium]